MGLGLFDSMGNAVSTKEVLNCISDKLRTTYLKDEGLSVEGVLAAEVLLKGLGGTAVDAIANCADASTPAFRGRVACQMLRGDTDARKEFIYRYPFGEMVGLVDDLIWTLCGASQDEDLFKIKESINRAIAHRVKEEMTR